MRNKLNKMIIAPEDLQQGKVIEMSMELDQYIVAEQRKKLEQISKYLVSGNCLLCACFKGNGGSCEGRVYSKGCLEYIDMKSFQKLL